MELRFIHFYPQLMSLYGSYANVAVLRRHLEDLGNTVTVETVQPGEDCDLTGADFIFLGAGTERAQKTALADLRRFGDQLSASANAGTAMRFAGTAMDLLGKSITDENGQVYEGLGLAEFSTTQGKRRYVEDVYGHTDLYEEAVVGFMNKCSVITGVEHPLLTKVKMGMGNEAEKGPEGYHRSHVYASHLTGPLLVKNPQLLERVMADILGRHGLELPAERPAYPYEEQGYAVTEEQLRLRWEN